MTANERADAERLLAQLRERQQGDGVDVVRERLSMIAKMLLAYPQGNADAASGAARSERYLGALDDVHPAILKLALRQWDRGEAGDGHNYEYGPPSGVLRQMCLSIRDRELKDIRHLEDLLSAITLDQAMDPKPLNALIPVLQAMPA